MNLKYWQKFYSNKHIKRPSKFVKFVRKNIKKNLYIADVGCGNGRDTYYLAKKNEVHGFDFACKPKDKGKAMFFQMGISEAIEYLKSYDVIYGRFLLHAVDSKTQTNLIKAAKNYVVFEARSNKGKKPCNTHQRRLIDGNKLIKQLLKNKFKIIYYEERRGLAKYKGENPFVIRVIAKKYGKI